MRLIFICESDAPGESSSPSCTMRFQGPASHKASPAKADSTVDHLASPRGRLSLQFRPDRPCYKDRHSDRRMN